MPRTASIAGRKGGGMDEDDAGLWRALQPLRSVCCFLMTGAHPDDEWNGFLAWLGLGLGVRTIYACSTRGEGGQNALGPERGRALGALRSREMEQAAAVLGLAVRWLGAWAGRGDDDPVFDFGFSKSAEDTLARWGEARLLARLVRLIRSERPDAISPTFLDVPGQHGHHRAMTRCTLRAAALAADPGFPGDDLPPWRVAQVYLPAFSGGGGSYDDELPPPPATVCVDLGARCASLGRSWAQLGEVSRAFHASQGMGRDLPDGPRPFPLHLLSGRGDQAAPMDGLPHRLGDLADLLPAAAARPVRAAEAAIAEALAAFPARAAVADALHAALAALDAVDLPPDADPARRLALKRRQIGRAAALALRLPDHLAVTPVPLRAGRSARLGWTPAAGASVSLRVPPGWTVSPAAPGEARIDIPADAAPIDTLRDGWDPLGGHDPIGATLRWTHAGIAGSHQIDAAAPAALAPASEVTVSPRAVVRPEDGTAPVLLELRGAPPPPDWPARPHDGGMVEILAPLGRLDLPPAGTSLVLGHAPHVGAFARLEPAGTSVLRAGIRRDAGSRVGVVAGAVDTTLGWLRQLGLAAEAVDDATLQEGDLGRFTTLLVGIFGFGQRPALAAARARIMDWVAAGGVLVTLYHRPGDGWDPDATPPRRLVIGRPSVRWRVTQPDAPVQVLQPDHPILRHPNRIGPADWDGWVRERGLYFASDWDPAYRPLLALSDPNEAPLRGALLTAEVGRGRHVHVALALHHQFAALVPGAFRLLANLVAPMR